MFKYITMKYITNKQQSHLQIYKSQAFAKNILKNAQVKK